MACPDGAITFVNNRPTWTAERCQMCLRCLHHCPKSGLTYDGIPRGQYLHGK